MFAASAPIASGASASTRTSMLSGFNSRAQVTQRAVLEFSLPLRCSATIRIFAIFSLLLLNPSRIGRGTGVRVRIRIEVVETPDPHPALRATFSRGEKGKATAALSATAEAQSKPLVRNAATSSAASLTITPLLRFGGGAYDVVFR